MNKDRKECIKKVNSFKKQLKKTLSFLKKHIYNYKLEISLSVLIIVVIFLVVLFYPSSYLAQEDDNNLNDDLLSSESSDEVGQSIDDYLASVEKDNINKDDSIDVNDDLEEEIVDNGDEEEIVDDEKEREDEGSEDDNDDNEIDKDESDFSESFINSFGDSFSSGVYLNLKETNMYLDEYSSALTFEPLYDFFKLDSCVENGSTCDFHKDVQVLDGGMKACISGTNNCLKVMNDKLYYNNKKIDLPEKIRSEEIISLTVGALDTKFLLGAVLADNKDEYGLVYSFANNNFENIISKYSRNNISSKYQRQGGKIGFGGSDDNFLIVYAGYRGKAFQVLSDEIIDISDMFGLRVANKGFVPQILQSGSGGDSTWYICSLEKRKPKFIKLWQNSSKYIQGSLDLTYNIYTNNKLYNNFNHCYLSENDKHRVYLTFDNVSSLDIWQFQDSGFDTSHDYSVVSSDILDKEGYVAKNAVIKDISLSVSEKGYTNNINDYGTLYISTDNSNWNSVEVSDIFNFNKLSSDLYWRLDLKKGDDYFSPWFNNLNSLNYLLFKKD
ncbi:hypothetical protein K9M50_03515 [Patescibacteria group bacterium]|nr:hypothetical protein [Patescibacteria group bacterium]